MSSTSSGHFGGLFLSECEFDDVVQIWTTQLWPGRNSAIESNSAMTWMGGIDMELMKSPATFWRMIRVDSGATVGVLGGHSGGHVEWKSRRLQAYRTRGLWVSPSARRQGVAHRLIRAAFSKAAQESCEAVWTFPRQSSMPFYESVGFERAGAWVAANDSDADEVTPNCYAICTALRSEK